MAANANMHNLTTLIKRYVHLQQRRRGHVSAAVFLFVDGVRDMEIDPLRKQTRLTNMFDRLEAATSRLEDMATAVDPSHAETVTAIHSASANAPPPAESAPAPPPAPAPEPVPRSIEDFDTLIEDDVKKFVTASEKIGGLVAEQVGQSGTLL